MKKYDYKTFDQLSLDHQKEAEKSMRHCGCTEKEISQAKKTNEPVFSVFNSGKDNGKFRGFLMNGII